LTRMLRAIVGTGLGLALLAGCSRKPATPADAASARTPIVTIGADQAVSPVPPWEAPAIEITEANAPRLRKQAAAALKADRLFDGPEDAIPIYLALQKHAPGDGRIRRELAESLRALLKQGDAALAGIDEDPLQLRRAHEVAAVARVVAPADPKVAAFLARLDRADEAQQANRLGEQELNAGRVGETGKGGAIPRFHEALSLRPGDARAEQGLAAAESALIRRAEAAAHAGDYDSAEYWLTMASTVRDSAITIDDARQRIAMERAARVNALRDQGIAALSTPTPAGLKRSRERLADLLRIAASADPAAAELRERIDLATHYGLFRPGQVFTDAMPGGGRGPQLMVIPHGAFRMGAAPNEAGASDAERPTRNIRFDRGLAMSRTEVTVGEFRRFINATRYRTRASRRGYSTAYDERSGNLVRRGNVDWQSGYTGQPAADDMPVLHVSARDAMRYAEWLSEQTGQRYRLPSEAEFEYALRAGNDGRFAWGDDLPPARSGNFTGALDVSPGGRRWSNAFPGYGDGAWGPAVVGSYAANAYGLHDMPGNVSEWVADCWHDSYRRAPKDAQAWDNPGCRTRVARGGSWASSPVQTRSAWRQGLDSNNTSARVGFRVVREI